MEIIEWIRFLVGTAFLLSGLAIFIFEMIVNDLHHGFNFCLVLQFPMLGYLPVGLNYLAGLNMAEP